MAFVYLLFYTCIFKSEKYWTERSYDGDTRATNKPWENHPYKNSMELLRVSKLVPSELQYVRERGLDSTSITLWKLSNKLLMDILTIYYQYSIRRLTWNIKSLKQNIFFTCQPYSLIQWSSIPINLILSFNDLQYMRL